MSYSLAKDAYEALPFRAHSFLADVPLLDVWEVPLEGHPNPTLADLDALDIHRQMLEANALVKGLFELRLALGRLFGLDDPQKGAQRAPKGTFASRLTDDDRARSADPLSVEAMGYVLYAFEDERLEEIANKTVHAFMVTGLRPCAGGRWRLIMAVYVKKVSWVTPLYMALIKPFRHHIVYPAMLGAIGRVWRERYGTSPSVVGAAA